MHLNSFVDLDNPQIEAFAPFRLAVFSYSRNWAIYTYLIYECSESDERVMHIVRANTGRTTTTTIRPSTARLKARDIFPSPRQPRWAPPSGLTMFSIINSPRRRPKRPRGLRPTPPKSLKLWSLKLRSWRTYEFSKYSPANFRRRLKTTGRKILRSTIQDAASHILLFAFHSFLGSYLTSVVPAPLPQRKNEKEQTQSTDFAGFLQASCAEFQRSWVWWMSYIIYGFLWNSGKRVASTSWTVN